MVITEAVFDNGSGRCDLLDCDTHTVFEIVESESTKSIDLKKFKYPDLFTINVLLAKDASLNRRT